MVILGNASPYDIQREFELLKQKVGSTHGEPKTRETRRNLERTSPERSTESSGKEA